MNEYKELSRAAFSAGRIKGHLDALKIMVAALDRAPLEAKASIMDACEQVSRLKDKEDTPDELK